MPDEPALHGRSAPLAALRDALARAGAGRGALAIVSGEAGIGKTAIATAIAREAEASGAAVTWGRAWEFAEAPPYFPVAPCLRALGVDAGGDAFALWERVIEALARATAPVVWIVEDLHAADLGTLDLLTFLAQPLRAMRVLVVATARERDPRITDRMAQRLTRMTRDGLAVRLDPLDDREIAAVIEATIGRAPSREVVEKIAQLTGGNPLFVVECARIVKQTGAITSLSPSVRQIVNERVALLPDSAREALGAGAVLGREFAAATIARMDGTLPARAIDTLLPALRAGIVRETAPGRFVFSHTLVRDAIEDALAAEARAELHARAAHALVGDASEIVVERARHALAAGRGDGDTETLVARALELLEREGAFDRAHELHARIETAREAGVLPRADAPSLLHAARIARAAGRGDQSRRLCERVAAMARASGDAELLARAALLHLSDVRPGVIDRAQVALIEEARIALGDRAPALGCRVLARLATALQPAPDPHVPEAMAEEARTRALALGDPNVVADVLELGGWGIYETPPARRIAWADELLAHANATADLRRAISAYLWRGATHIEIGDFTAFDRDVASMLAAADELGHPRDRWRALLYASMQAIATGRDAVSDRCVTEVEQLAPLTDDPAIVLSLPLHLFMRALHLRRDDDARARAATLDTALASMLNATTVIAMLRGVAAARAGDLEAARAQLAIARPRIPLESLAAMTTGTSEPWVAYLGELIAFAGDAGERKLARALLGRLTIDEVCGGPMSFSYDGPSARVRGLVAASLGDREAAERELRAALANARARDHAPWVAQLASELAAVLGGGVEGRALADEAAAIARAIGMTGLARDAAPDAGPLRLERSGADWRLTRGTASVTIRDSRGVQLLARLIDRPGEELHVLALASDDGAAAPESTAGDVLDDRARKAYRRRLDELAEALTDAVSRGDAKRARAIERERDALVRELARATGLGGKARAASSTTERARVNVQKRLKDAISRVAEADAELGRHLEATVRTGTYCAFKP
ncbi:MAG TPA: AAA family ATPase [Kofleriaceae bacterium]|nr:AAA family ATPase [Kofleriaceae bacterium]